MVNHKPESTSENESLRWTFVEMLFALAVSQVAIHAADLVALDDPWSEKLPAIAHLTATFLLIATSWLGWRRSRSPGMLEELKYIFSLRFLALLSDVFLVVVYFIMARSVEIEINDGITLGAPSARPESIGLFIVFLIYTVWDLSTDVLSPGCVPGDQLLSKKGFKAAFVSTFASVACLAFTGLVWIFATPNAAQYEVVALDFALICVILLFRQLKAIENPLARLLQLEDCKAWKKQRETQGTELRWGLVLGVAYLLLLLVACKTSGVPDGQSKDQAAQGSESVSS